MQKVFKANNIDAHLGKYAFGFTWGAWFAMFLATLMLFVGCGLGGRKDTTTTSANSGFYRRQRRQSATRHSFVDGESQRRVKDEYA